MSFVIGSVESRKGAAVESIRYLLNRPLCFRLEREFAGADFGVAETSPSPTDQPCLTKAHTTTRPKTPSARSWLDAKNWLFIGTQQVGERAAVILTLIESAKLNGHDPWAYFKDVLERLPTLKNADLHLLLPHNWATPTTSAAIPAPTTLTAPPAASN